MPSHHNPNKFSKNSSVSTMIKQGFISDPLLSPPSLSPFPSSPSPPPPPSRFSSSSTTTASTVLSPPSSSPTLLDMMSEEQARESKNSIQARNRIQDRIFKALMEAPFNRNHQWGSGDVKLTVGAPDGFRVSMEVHREVLVRRSRFFAEKLRRNGAHVVSLEILERDDVEIYVEALVLMYSEDFKRKLVGQEVSKVLQLLKVCSDILFEDGVTACLEYLEAIPWSENEEEKVVSLLTELHLHNSVSIVLQRLVSTEPTKSSSRTEDVFLKMFSGVLQAKDDKARREMKTMISRLLKEEENSDNSIDVSKDTLYHLCHRCLSCLVLSLSEATCIDESTQDRGVLMGDIAREADNLQWVVDILIDRRIGEEFVQLWSEQKELAGLHSKIPTMYGHEISKITAQLCVAIGRGQILVPKETRYGLLSTWLEALYEDFGWMKRACRSLDKKLIEEGLGNTILTLPLAQEQAILLNWFDRYLNKGDDCPNIQRAFEIWWRRSFIKHHVAEPHLQITTSDYSS